MGQPKSLLDYQGKTFFDIIIDKFRQVGCDPVIAVISKGCGLKSEDLSRRNILYCINETPGDGQFSSLRLGVNLVPSAHDAAFFCPVDHPVFQISTLRHLIAAGDEHSSLSIRPKYKDRHGHPVLLGRYWFDKILSSPLDSNMRNLLFNNPDKAKSLPVDDPGILVDIDTPDEYLKLIQT